MIIAQKVAVLIDGNNIERGLHSKFEENRMIDFDSITPKLLNGRGLSRLVYFREGEHISEKLTKRLRDNFFGATVTCHKSADIPLTIEAIQLASKVDTIIILSGDSDYVELVKYLKRNGVSVEICGVYGTVSRSLIETAEYNTFINKSDTYMYNTNYGSESKTPEDKTN